MANAGTMGFTITLTSNTAKKKCRQGQGNKTCMFLHANPDQSNGHPFVCAKGTKFEQPKIVAAKHDAMAAKGTPSKTC